MKCFICCHIACETLPAVLVLCFCKQLEQTEMKHIFPYNVTAVDLQTQPQLQNDQQDSEGGCMC